MGSVGFFDYVGYDAFGLVFVVVSDFVYVVAFVSAASPRGARCPGGLGECRWSRAHMCGLERPNPKQSSPNT